ncbi:holliday junction resolvase isoform X2 [Tasmannia lanceolata]
MAQVVLDAAIKLCRVYSQAIKWDSYVVNTDEDENSMNNQRVDNVTHIINIVTCTIENLYELGILAASGGGNLVTILNISWKGVVTLLQLGKGALADKINIGDVIQTLISLATESLRCTAELWSSASKETLTIVEAKRSFLPIKFYLINAVRICSQYPSQALGVYKEISLCVLMISAFGISLSKETHLKAASESLAEFLEPTSFLLLLTLLNSAEVKHDSKLQILDWLFSDESLSNSMHREEIISTVPNPTASLGEIFRVNCEALPRTRKLLLGQVVLFLDLLKSSPDLREEVVLGISTKLGCLFDFLIDEEVYSSILVLHVPVLSSSGPTPELSWNPMFSYVLHALKTFMVVATATLAWDEVESFLLTNFFHPHFLCSEIVTELLCFLVRHSEIEMANDIIDRLCSLFKMMPLSESALLRCFSLRKMARSISIILSYATESTIDRVYSSILSDDRSHSSAIMYNALLMEGFPLNLLSDNLRKISNQRILTAFCAFIENTGEILVVDGSSRSRSSVGLPVHALASLLLCPQINNFNLDEKSISGALKFTVAVIHEYKNASNTSHKDQCSKLLSQVLEIISNIKHLYANDHMEELILELHTLFVAGPFASDIWLYQCKPALASFMAGLSHMDIAEGEGSKISSAVWELYHMLLRERHWAFVHLVLNSFGYFAARTSCNQLWRFVPPDAALSFDKETGSETSEERFMSELKAFLEKEAALVVHPCKEQLGLLRKDGLELKRTFSNDLNVESEVPGPQIMEIDDEEQVMKKRKVPDGINEGMGLLQSGLKAIGDGLTWWKQQQDDSNELQEEFSSHISCLQDVISHLVRLADRD